MSFAKLEEIRCPCGEVFEAELWNAINAQEDPELKEALLCGEINVVCCPACSQIFYAEHFVLYHDSAKELLAFVYPSSFETQATHCAAKMKEDFQRALGDAEHQHHITYDPILLFGLDALVEILRAEDELEDETAILDYVAKDLGLDIIQLKPALARRCAMLHLLPRKARHGKTQRDEILEGLRKLTTYNAHLTHYIKLLQDIDNNPAWKLDPKLIVAKEHTH